MSIIRLLYPEKLLTQHFLAPSQREKIQAALLEKKQQSFNALLRILKRTGKDDKDAQVISTMIERVCNSGVLAIPACFWCNNGMDVSLPILLCRELV